MFKIVRRDQHTTTESFEPEFRALQKLEPASRSHEGLVDILTLGLLAHLHGHGLAGLNGGVQALAVSGTNLYIGGGFAKAGGSNAFFVAQWNGSKWSALG